MAEIAELESSVSGRSSGPILEISGLSRRFGDRWALRGVSLSVDHGETLALVGHNGSGKTTLLRILSTVLRPTHGSGQVFGYDLLRERGEIRQRVGILGHRPGIYGDLTASENLRFALRMSGLAADRSRISEALASVSLGEYADELVRGFSAGMQRRVSLARLFLLRPRLVLLDEPYSSFDSAGIDLINAYLRDHRARGGSAIVATHDIERGRGVLDRLIELDRGRVLASEGVL